MARLNNKNGEKYEFTVSGQHSQASPRKEYDLKFRLISRYKYKGLPISESKLSELRKHCNFVIEYTTGMDWSRAEGQRLILKTIDVYRDPTVDVDAWLETRMFAYMRQLRLYQSCGLDKKTTCYCKSFFGAGNGNRTRTVLSHHGILSPGRLPISPFRHIGNIIPPICRFCQVYFNAKL